MVRKIGAITVGQSPRTDVTGEMEGLLGGAQLVERGALDGLTAAEIAAFAPVEGEYMLVTKLRDGSSVRIAKRHILAQMQRQIDDLVQGGVQGILLLCTGDFPTFKCAKPVLYPQRLLQYFVASVYDTQCVGVLIPDIGQVPQATERWQKNGVASVLVEPANPYAAAEDVIKAAIGLRDKGAEVIVMDCIGYTDVMKKEITKQTSLPVVLPRTVAARTVGELFG